MILNRGDQQGEQDREPVSYKPRSERTDQQQEGSERDGGRRAAGEERNKRAARQYRSSEFLGNLHEQWLPEPG